MLDIMESIIADSHGGGEDEETEDREGKKCENCGMVHGHHPNSKTTDDERSKIQAQVDEVLTGNGGMLSIIGPLKDRKSNDSINIFFSRRMHGADIVNGLLNVFSRAFKQVASGMDRETRKGFKQVVMKTLDQEL